jgi:hypothetical protein
MKRWSLVATVGCLSLTGCYSVPDKADFAIDVPGNYKAVSDCAWLEFRKLEGWTKDDLDSMQKVEFSYGNTSSTAGRIDIQAAGPNATRVTSYFPKAVWGAEFWVKKHKPVFQACAS